MTQNSISRRDEYNQILRNLTTFYSTESQALYDLLVEKGISKKEIAQKLGVRQNALNCRFQKKGAIHA